VPIEVQVGEEVFEFPDDTPEEQIRGVMQQRFAPPKPATFQGAVESDLGSNDPMRIAQAQQRLADQALGMTKTGLETGQLTQAQKEKMLREAAGVEEINPVIRLLGGASTGASKGIDTPYVLGLSAADLLLGAVGAGDTKLGKGVEDQLKRYKEHHRLMSEQDRQMYGEGDIPSNFGSGVAQAAVELPLTIVPGAGASTPAAAVTRSALAGATVGGGSKYAQERGEGAGRDVAALQGAVSGAITGATTGRFGATGIEAIFKKAGPKGVMAVVKEGLADAGMEGTEELTDTIQQDLVERITKNPDKPFYESFKESLMAFGVGAILGGGVSTAKGGIDTATEAIDRRAADRQQLRAFDAAEAIADQEVAGREIPDLKDTRQTFEVKGPFPDQNIPLEPSIGGTDNVNLSEATAAPERPDDSVRMRLYREAEAQNKLAKQEFAPVHKQILEVTGLTQRELDALNIPSVEEVSHPDEIKNIASDLARNAPGGRLNKLYDLLAGEGKTGKFIWGGTAENPTIGFDPDVPDARPDPAAAQRALKAVNDIQQCPLPGDTGANCAGSRIQMARTLPVLCHTASACAGSPKACRCRICRRSNARPIHALRCPSRKRTVAPSWSNWGCKSPTRPFSSGECGATSRLPWKSLPKSCKATSRRHLVADPP